MSAVAAYTIPTTPQALYQEHGETVVNIASYMATRLYAARGRLDMMREAAERGDSKKAAEHAQRSIEYSAAIRDAMRRHGAAGREAFALAKKMEGPRA